jgi:ATPase subunit of ABC transporter with duplicated ATPase domains
LLGLNGCGKSTLLTAIGCRELPIPEHMDIYHLSHEIEASDMSALQAVVTCDEERVKLEKEAEILAAQASSWNHRIVTFICSFSMYCLFHVANYKLKLVAFLG